MKGLLKGERALISGGSRGIGAEIARYLSGAGADVAVGYNQSSRQAENVVRECLAQGVRAISCNGDVRFREDVQEMTDRTKRELGGPPSILVHSAGVEGVGLFQDVTEDEYEVMMDTHVKGAFHLIQSVLPSMISVKAGRIILISSIWGESGGAGEVLYSAAKGAINGMTRGLAKEVAPSGITVNAVSPGAIQTDMINRQLSAEDQEQLAEEIPTGRLGSTQDVASLVNYLCLPEAGYITGQVLHVNGGWYP